MEVLHRAQEVDMNYEQKRRQEIKEVLEKALEDGDLEKFEAEYRDHALRYMTKRDRWPLMRQFLRMKIKEVK